MKIGIVAIAIVGVFGSGGAFSSEKKKDGNELLSQCQEYIKVLDSDKSAKYLDVAYCSGFVQGVVDTVYFLSDDLKKDAKFCIPENVTRGQQVRVLVKYLKDNPERLHMDRIGLTWDAFRTIYPCK